MEESVLDAVPERVKGEVERRGRSGGFFLPPWYHSDKELKDLGIDVSYRQYWNENALMSIRYGDPLRDPEGGGAAVTLVGGTLECQETREEMLFMIDSFFIDLGFGDPKWEFRFPHLSKPFVASLLRGFVKKGMREAYIALLSRYRWRTEFSKGFGTPAMNCDPIFGDILHYNRNHGLAMCGEAFVLRGSRIPITLATEVRITLSTLLSAIENGNVTGPLSPFLSRFLSSVSENDAECRITILLVPEWAEAARD